MTAFWDFPGMKMISNCISKAAVSEASNEEAEMVSEMEALMRVLLEMLEENLSFACSFEEDIAVVEDVLPFELMGIKDFCSESPEEEDPNETHEESVPMPTYSEAVKTVKTLQGCIHSVGDIL